ncbi:MAG: YndJ family transporter [Saprospiraceae bacterium]|nr:YndJ family transporter [Saprospiraceae bacterium]
MLEFARKYRISIGGLLWLLWVLAKHPHPLHQDWGKGLLLLAALVVVPLATEVLTRTAPFSNAQILRRIITWQLPAAMSFALAFSMESGWLAMLLALPWEAVLLAMAWCGLTELKKGAWREAVGFSLSAGLALLSVAAAWAVVERLGVYPLGFSPDIVFLTIAHFHFAGFVLPVLAGLATRQLGQPILSQILCYMAVFAVGLLAVGITLTHLGIDSDWEMASAWFMAISAAGIAVLHLRLVFQKSIVLKIRLLWLCSAMALLCGMVLAGLYGSRFIAPVAWLDIPMMRALHGTLNAVGFGLCGVIGHYLLRKKTT